MNSWRRRRSRAANPNMPQKTIDQPRPALFLEPVNEHLGVRVVGPELMVAGEQLRAQLRRGCRSRR